MKFNAHNCPITAAFLLAMRAEFGDVKVTHLDENGVTHGEPSQGSYVQPVIEKSGE